MIEHIKTLQTVDTDSTMYNNSYKNPTTYLVQLNFEQPSVLINLTFDNPFIFMSFATYGYCYLCLDFKLTCFRCHRGIIDHNYNRGIITSRFLSLLLKYIVLLMSGSIT